MLLLVLFAALAILVSVLLQRDTAITGAKIPLGLNLYDVKVLDAPIATATTLDVMSWILTKSPFGPALRRYLVNKNQISELRDLAAQIKTQPLTFPMKRVNAEEYASLSPPEAVEEAKSLLLTGFWTSLVTAESTSGIANNFPRTIGEYHTYYRQGGDNLPSALMRKALATVKEWEGKDFRIFSSIREEEVLAEARASDERWKRGEPLSVFDGVPVAFKDMMDVKGHTIYDGKNPGADHAAEWIVSQEDSLMVTRLRELGAIVFGMTITVEGGVSPLGFNAHFKGPVSPYSFSRYSGGSSAGSAVAVATGIVPVAIGYDGGGSVRLPACMSGVHGLATSFGRIPFHNHSDSSMIKAGPLAASSQDAALTLAAIAPNAPGSFYTDMYDGGVNGPPQPHLSGFSNIQDLSDVRLGVYPEWFSHSDAHIQQEATAALESLKRRGAQIVEIHIPHLRIMGLAHAFKISTEFALGWDAHFYNYPDSMEPGGRVVVGLGSTVTALEALAADKLRAWGKNYVNNLFKEHDLTAIVNPTMPVEVPELTESAKLRGESNTVLSVKVMRYIFIANLLGLPGYSVPIGHAVAQDPPSTPAAGEAGEAPLRLPTGLHFLGNHWEEHKLLRLAHAVEAGHTRQLPNRPRPMFFYDPFA